jgi:hypothetical protein
MFLTKIDQKSNEILVENYFLHLLSIIYLLSLNHYCNDNTNQKDFDLGLIKANHFHVLDIDTFTLTISI